MESVSVAFGRMHSNSLISIFHMWHDEFDLFERIGQEVRILDHSYAYTNVLVSFADFFKC